MAPSPASVTSPENLTLRSIDDYLEAIEHSRTNEPIELDWEKLRRIEAPTASILSQALIGALGTLPLIIRAPQAMEQMETVFRSGISFALANRLGQTRVVPPLGSHARWRRSWVPGELFAMRSLFQEHLFDPQEFGLQPDVFGRYHAAFINTHRLPAKGSQVNIGSIVRPWLIDVLPNLRSKGVGSPRRQTFLSHITAILDELIENVREHAPRRIDGLPSQSLVQLSVTLGGGAESFNRVYISVQDSGPGIVATARPKLRFTLGSELDDAELLGHLLEGDLDPWNQGRGMGLPKIWRIVRSEPSAGLWLASNELRLAASDGSLAPASDGFDIGGSVVVAMIPEPRLDD